MRVRRKRALSIQQRVHERDQKSRIVWSCEDAERNANGVKGRSRVAMGEQVNAITTRCASRPLQHRRQPEIESVCTHLAENLVHELDIVDVALAF